jgi:hypothetical protein
VSKGPWKRKGAPARPEQANGSKPSLGLPDPLEAAQEAARNFQEGNTKLARAVDTLRTALETIVIAEIDNETGLPVSSSDLRKLATEALNAYSIIAGQSWKRVKLTGPTRAGDRSDAVSYAGG